MPWDMITKVLENKEFVFLATADVSARPNVAPKFLVKIDHKDIYLVDLVAGRTWQNVQANPRAAISFMDQETLHGYLLRGAATAITSGPDFDRIIKEFQDKQLSLIAARIAEGVSRSKKHKSFDFALPQKGGVIKFKVEEVVEIGSGGKLKTETV